jgi:hypothetical protein
VAQSHTPRNRCVRFVFGVAAAAASKPEESGSA